MAISSALLTVFLTPLIFTVSLFLLPLAILTTTVALSALLIRVLYVYLGLAATIALNHLSDLRTSYSYESTAAVLSTPAKRPKSTRSISMASISSSGAQTPKPHGSFVYNAAPSLARDYEGVGGWRLANEDTDAEEEWVMMNARLELPAVATIPEERQRKHQRSLTQGALVDKVGQRRRTGNGRPQSVILSGTSSPGGALRESGRARSAVLLGDTGMNVGRPRGKARRTSGSSESSGSGNTLTMKEK